ncbi:MAG: putative signal transducing protein [Actinomycetota bacterium]
MSDEQFVAVYQGGGGPPQFELLRSVLAGSGIDCVIEGGTVGPYPVNVGGLGEFTVYVKEADAEDAVELLRDTLEQ